MKEFGVCWKTAEEIFGKDYEVIQNGISPNQLYQGYLGDFYLLSSISALAEHPERIKRLLLTQEKNEEGVYTVALNLCGVWKKVHVDSYFPTKDGKQLYGACNQEAEIWVMLLEKAYAKLYSGYWNIGHGGSADSALQDLTGAPSEFQSINEKTEKEDLWSRLVQYDQKGYVVGCQVADDYEGINGLHGGHGYTLIGVHNFNGERVVELRNPWGCGEWTGDWSEYSEKWTQDLREKHQPRRAEDDGRFFIPYEDFTKYCNGLKICYYEKCYSLSSFNDELDNNFVACYKATVRTGGLYYVILSQEDKKSFYNPNFGRSGKIKIIFSHPKKDEKNNSVNFSSYFFMDFFDKFS